MFLSIFWKHSWAVNAGWAKKKKKTNIKNTEVESEKKVYGSI